MNLRIYAIIWILFVLVGCKSDFVDNDQKRLYLGVNDNSVSTRRLESCTILYSMTNFASQIDRTSQQTALKNTAELWGQAHGHLELKEAAGRTPAITVTFTDSANFATKMSKEGLVSQPLKALSAIKRTANGSTCTILLRKSYDWKLPVLQRVLLYQIGVALGLQDSNEEESAMAMDNTYEKIGLSRADSLAVSALYNQPCDEWTKIETQIPLSASNLIYIRATFSNQTKGYCIIDLLRGANKVVEFDPSLGGNNWIERKAFPGTASPLAQSVLVSFTVANRMFVGNLYRTQTGKFWEYIPAKGAEDDSWKPIADCPFIGTNVQAFGIGNKGYLISRETGKSDWFVYTFDPTANKWANEPSLSLPSPETATPISDLPSFSLGETVYIMTSQHCWRFNPATPTTPWQKMAFLPIYGNFTTFTVRNYGFFAGTQLWRFNEKSNWQLGKTLPARMDFPDFVLSIAKRVFIHRNGVFYRYNP